MIWRPHRHVDAQRQWPPLAEMDSPSVELALRALWLLYNRGVETRDVHGDLEEMNYRTNTFLILYFHDCGHVKIYGYIKPNRIKSLVIDFDWGGPRRWDAGLIDEVLFLMRKDMILDDLTTA